MKSQELYKEPLLQELVPIRTPKNLSSNVRAKLLMKNERVDELSNTSVLNGHPVHGT